MRREGKRIGGRTDGNKGKGVKEIRGEVVRGEGFQREWFLSSFHVYRMGLRFSP